MLQKESELPLDELLKDYLDNRESIIVDEPSSQVSSPSINHCIPSFDEHYKRIHILCTPLNLFLVLILLGIHKLLFLRFSLLCLGCTDHSRLVK